MQYTQIEETELNIVYSYRRDGTKCSILKYKRLNQMQYTQIEETESNAVYSNIRA